MFPELAGNIQVEEDSANHQSRGAEELRLCTKLKELILVYTKTRRFPEWMKEFTRLEYFHVENDLIHSSL
ncbi:hypothetical protein PI124_g19727 [Phytophthora idaei]|nr:hypothetical protein PI126_g19196 [Phytophthora idaei]KAG3235236.1 hypothetical protein PI124_g19727 [Phytophthora idaei]